MLGNSYCYSNMKNNFPNIVHIIDLSISNYHHKVNIIMHHKLDILPDTLYIKIEIKSIPQYNSYNFNYQCNLNREMDNLCTYLLLCPNKNIDSMLYIKIIINKFYNYYHRFNKCKNYQNTFHPYICINRK